MPTSQRAGLKRPDYVVIPRKEIVDEPFIFNDVDFCRNTMYFYDGGSTVEIEINWPLKDVVHLPRHVIRRRIWCLPCKNNERHIVVNNIAFPESLWDDFGITVKKIISKED